MRPFIAAVIAAAVCSLQAQALAFHVHPVPDQSRSDRHTHTPAIHHHEHHHDHDNSAGERGLSVTREDVDTIKLMVPAAVSFDALDRDAVTADVWSFEQPELTARMPPVELRSHGPPLARSTFLRGPPPSTQS